MKKETRKIENKNYFILAILFLVSILITMYICRWINIYKEKELLNSPLEEEIVSFELNELNEIISEMTESILYISYTNDSDIFNLDNRFKRIIERYNLSEEVYYININKYLTKDEYINKIIEVFPELEKEKLKAPLLIYTKGGRALKVKSSGKKLITTTDFENLIGLLEVE